MASASSRFGIRKTSWRSSRSRRSSWIASWPGRDRRSPRDAWRRGAPTSSAAVGLRPMRRSPRPHASSTRRVRMWTTSRSHALVDPRAPLRQPVLPLGDHAAEADLRHLKHRLVAAALFGRQPSPAEASSASFRVDTNSIRSSSSCGVLGRGTISRASSSIGIAMPRDSARGTHMVVIRLVRSFSGSAETAHSMTRGGAGLVPGSRPRAGRGHAARTDDRRGIRCPSDA